MAEMVAGSGWTAGSEQTTTPYVPFHALLWTQLVVLNRAFVPP